MEVKTTKPNPEYFKKYYRDNIEKYKLKNEERKLIKVVCPTCQCTVVKKHYKKHTETKKHINNISNNKDDVDVLKQTIKDLEEKLKNKLDTYII
jgi:hypothetical protein